MRVIAGEAKGHALKAPRGTNTRPTADKIKGAIFSIIESILMSRFPEREHLWEGRQIIDLFAGSGALGIEALSRGADWADFVEEAPAAGEAIRENLAHTLLTARAKIHCLSVLRSLGVGYRNRLKAPFDVVFMDPPYADVTITEVLERVSQPSMVKSDGIIVVEHSRRVSLPERSGAWGLLKSRRHGDTVISVFVNINEAEMISEGITKE